MPRTVKHGANLFDEDSAARNVDPLRHCKVGRHVTKIFNKMTGEKICLVCKRTIRETDGGSDDDTTKNPDR